MKLKKTLIALGTTLAVLGASSSTWANPDYICVKSVEDTPCVVSKWDPWLGDENSKTRVGYGKRVSEVVYYNLRTSCEPGYTNKGSRANIGGSDGRRGVPDRPHKYDECTITQTDSNKPIGNPNKNADQTKKFDVPEMIELR